MLEGDRRAAGGVDLQHHHAALPWMHDFVELEVGARLRHRLQPHGQRLVAGRLALEGVEARARDGMRTVVGHAPHQPGPVVALQRRRIGQRREVLADVPRHRPGWT
jgi:hypothetical protein